MNFDNKITFLTILLGILSFISCDSPSEPEFHNEISVSCILRPYLHYQRVYVYYTTDQINEDIVKDSLFVRNAKVTISNVRQTVRFSYHRMNDYQKTKVFIDKDEKLIVIPGERYQLHIETDIGEVNGETLVPSEFHIVEPADSQVVRNRNITIKWTGVKNSFWYFGNILSPAIQQIGYSSVYRKIVTFNTCYTSISSTLSKYSEMEHLYYVGDSTRYTIKIIGVDKNVKNNIIDKIDCCGLDSGYGIFGSAIIDSINVLLRRNDDNNLGKLPPRSKEWWYGDHCNADLKFNSTGL